MADTSAGAARIIRPSQVKDCCTRLSSGADIIQYVYVYVYVYIYRCIPWRATAVWGHVFAIVTIVDPC